MANAVNLHALSIYTKITNERAEKTNKSTHHEARGGGVQGGEGAVADEGVHGQVPRQVTGHHASDALAVNHNAHRVPRALQ